MSTIGILSEGDLEVITLHEAHGALAKLIGPDLYTILGDPPNQQVQFSNQSTFDLFLMRVSEFFAEGTRASRIDGEYKNWSLLSALSWFCRRYPDETNAAGLDDALTNLIAWHDKQVPLKFSCPEVELDIELTLPNSQLVSFGANTAKHHILRLSGLIGKLDRYTKSGNYNFTPQQLIVVLKAMMVEVESRLVYHATYITELLGHVFLALNAIVCERFAVNPTNRVRDMFHPEGITSDVYRGMYGDVLVFKQYEESRIRAHTPVTHESLKLAQKLGDSRLAAHLR